MALDSQMARTRERQKQKWSFENIVENHPFIEIDEFSTFISICQIFHQNKWQNNDKRIIIVLIEKISSQKEEFLR
jgi:hypothetical protein